MNIEMYLTDRVDNQIKYFSSKSALNKNYFLGFKITQLIAAALLPFSSAFITDFDSIKYVVALLGTMVTILEGILTVGKYQEKWITYRATGEALRQEKFLFLMKSGSYTGEDASTNFVNRIEMILGKENLGWQQMIVKEKPANEQNQPNGRSSAEETSTSTPGNNARPNNSVPTAANTDTSSSNLIDPVTGVTPNEEDTQEELNEEELALVEELDEEPKHP